MPEPTSSGPGGGRSLAAASAGALCVSSSAILMQLGGATASVTALGRCVFALPVLGAMNALDHKRGAGSAWAPLASRSRWLARISGVFLAADLILWSHSIAAIGAGLGTVVPSFQVLFIALLGWLFLGERPRRSLLYAAPVMLAGLVLVGGLTGTKAYGADPALGVAEGLGVAVLYSLYIMMLRQALKPDTGPSPVAALYEATLGAAAGSVVIGLALRDFRLPHPWPALGWLALLALSSQVVGWLLITMSMPKLPAWMIGAILLIQPVGTVTLGYLILSEQPSGSQLAGVALMLAGVLLAVGLAGRRPEVKASPAEHEDHPPGAGSAEGDVAVEVAVARGDREPAG